MEANMDKYTLKLVKKEETNDDFLPNICGLIAGCCASAVAGMIIGNFIKFDRLARLEKLIAIIGMGGLGGSISVRVGEDTADAVRELLDTIGRIRAAMKKQEEVGVDGGK